MEKENNVTAENKITIAYAEDERWFRKPTVEMLLQGGFDVIAEFEDGTELLEFLESCEVLPDLCLTDLRMPRMNGFRLTEEILSKFPDTKVVILTSETDRFYIEEAEKIGAVGFLHKIIDHKNIIQALIEVHVTGTTQIGKLHS